MNVSINKFGETDNLDATPTDVHDGASAAIVALGGTIIWVAPTAARIHSIVSSNGADDGEGLGLQTVLIHGLTSWDDRWDVHETVILDGTNPVNTVNEYVMIYRMRGLTWGANGFNVGHITATAAAPDSTITAAIIAGNSQTQMAIFGVSSRMILHLNQFRAALIKTAGVALRATGKVLWMEDPAVNAVFGTAWTNKESFEVTTDERWIREYNPPKVFEGPGIIKVQLIGSTANIDLISSFDGFITQAR